MGFHTSQQRESKPRKQKTNRFAVYLSMYLLAFTSATFLVRGMNATAVDGEQSAEVAVSSIENDHIHAVSLQTKDVTELINTLDENDAIVIDSSVGYDGGVPNGIPHTHPIRMTRAELIQLRDTGTVIIQSDISLGHRHFFKFIQKPECAPLATPVPTVSPGTTATPEATATPEVTVTPEMTATPEPTATATAAAT